LPEQNVYVGYPGDAVALGEARDGLEAELAARAVRTAAQRRERPRDQKLVPLSAPGRTRAGTLRRALAVADALGLLLTFLLVQLFVSNFQLGDLRISAVFLGGLATWLLFAHAYGFYARDEISVSRTAIDDLPGILVVATLASWLGLVFVNTFDLAHPKLHVATAFWLASITSVTVLRSIARTIVRRRLAPTEPTLIIGTGRVARQIAGKLALRPEYGLEVIGFLDDEPLDLPAEAPPHLGRLRRLEHVVRAYGIERVIVAFSQIPGDQMVELLRRCADLGVRADVIPRIYEMIGPRTVLHDVDGMPLISIKPAHLSWSARTLKRGMDIAVAGLSLLVFAPFFAFAAVMIKAESKGPVFFRQERMGAGGRRFRILKFRSMHLDADARKREVEHLNKHVEEGPRMFKVPGDPRTTRFGCFLRRWSLDELPQLLNVLRGEMSLVGPRPLILDEDQHIMGRHRRRLNLMPGVTGPWQVLGRSDIPFGEMVTLDYLYVVNWSLWGDVKLLFRTVPAVLRRRGAY
jgi:exopolysaccharide biosynthesis polyprenyl glycosylphosphotransferase